MLPLRSLVWSSPCSPPPARSPEESPGLCLSLSGTPSLLSARRRISSPGPSSPDRCPHAGRSWPRSRSDAPPGHVSASPPCGSGPPWRCPAASPPAWGSSSGRGWGWSRWGWCPAAALAPSWARSGWRSPRPSSRQPRRTRRSRPCWEEVDRRM